MSSIDRSHVKSSESKRNLQNGCRTGRSSVPVVREQKDSFTYEAATWPSSITAKSCWFEGEIDSPIIFVLSSRTDLARSPMSLLGAEQRLSRTVAKISLGYPSPKGGLNKELSRHQHLKGPTCSIVWVDRAVSLSAFISATQFCHCSSRNENVNMEPAARFFEAPLHEI
jgi:hypothetical protein